MQPKINPTAVFNQIVEDVDPAKLKDFLFNIQNSLIASNHFNVTKSVADNSAYCFSTLYELCNNLAKYSQQRGK